MEQKQEKQGIKYMIGKAWQEMLKEGRLLGAIHRRSLWVLVLMPLCYTVLFGCLFYQNALTKVPIGICNLDNAAAGRKLVTALNSTPEVRVALVTPWQEELEEAMKSGDIAGAVIIPRDLSEKLSTNQQILVEVIVNNSNTVSGGTIMKAVQGTIGTFSAQQAAEVRIGMGLMPEAAVASTAPIIFSLRSLYNSTGGYVDFFLAILVLHALQISLVFVLGPMMVLEKHRRFSKLQCSYQWILPAKAFFYTGLETVILMVCLVSAVVLFNLNCRGSLWSLLAIGGSFSFAMTGFAMCMGCWVNKPTKVISYALFYIMPSVLFSGAVWPRVSMDMFSLFLSYIMPIGYAAEDLRYILVGSPTPYLGVHCLALISVGGVFLLLAGKAFKLRKDEINYADADAKGNKATIS